MSSFTYLAPPMKEISSGRKTLYYLGGGIVVLGFILFISVFISAALNSGPISPSMRQGVDFTFLRGITGMICMVVGGIIMGIGARGAAGSGIILDPKQAREDLEPWARMGGGLVKDAVDESGINLSRGSELPFDEKLRRLEALKKDGLITDTEYQQKRSEILREKL
ncbi:MAG: SHOCT domain-containing protein [Chthoniobacterales bacterium]